MNGILAAHNGHRARHCAPALKWSTKVAAVAQRWADALKARNCAFDHSKGNGYGENLFWASGSGTRPSAVVASWYNEVKLYNFSRPGFTMKTGHFTQVVWVGTTELGCGVARCANGSELWVCNYAPAGNSGRYAQNVKPTGCRR